MHDDGLSTKPAPEYKSWRPRAALVLWFLLMLVVGVYFNSLVRPDFVLRGTPWLFGNRNHSVSSSGATYPADFRDYLAVNKFDVEGFANKKGYPTLSSEVTKVLYLLADYVSIPPPVEIKVDTRPKPLPPVREINCDDGYFKGNRPTPAHIIDVILFGYELDLLEIRLFELAEVVDEFIIWEGAFNQRGDRKPLIFNRNWERFSNLPFSHKIIHIIQDDSDILNVNHKEELSNGPNFSNEARKRFHAIDGYTKFKGGEDNIPSDHLLITGDLDEIPSAESIQAFKYCKKPGETASFYTTMWRFDLEHIVVMPDYHGYWSQPMITKIGLSYRHSRKHIVPYDKYRGAHMNRCLPPAQLVFKDLCMSGGGMEPFTWELHQEYLLQRCHWFEHKKPPTAPSKWHKPKYLPWFAVANPDRFPYLFPSRHPEFDYPKNISKFC